MFARLHPECPGRYDVGLFMHAILHTIPRSKYVLRHRAFRRVMLRALSSTSQRSLLCVCRQTHLAIRTPLLPHFLPRQRTRFPLIPTQRISSEDRARVEIMRTLTQLTSVFSGGMARRGTRVGRDGGGLGSGLLDFSFELGETGLEFIFVVDL